MNSPELVMKDGAYSIVADGSLIGFAEKSGEKGKKDAWTVRASFKEMGRKIETMGESLDQAWKRFLDIHAAYS